ncbi:MAG: GMC family oxidoreductase N-terminal domain-containing protein [Cytophagales bacterium]|nr:GMC family oxidoreductase N-terminal domain-containing protein [Cytophagales bacterium]
MYDYIIVGAGSSGCLLANRLSEDPGNQVLLFEAGKPDKDPLIKIPGAYGKLFKRPFDWGYYTEPQEHVNERKLYIPRGKTLGGSSSTNAMAYVRGNKADYDHWASLGNEGWAFDEVLPYFKRSEDIQHPGQVDEGYHGSKGELSVNFNEHFQSPYMDPFIQAGANWGLPKFSDYNGKSQKGVGRFQFTIKNGARHSSATAFLKPVMGRNNLTVRTGAHVEKIEFKDQKASGVWIAKKGGNSELISASKEVILSAGAIDSPRILLRSGIGAKDELMSLDIDVIRELPGVGKNLQDHLFYSVSSKASVPGGLNPVISPGRQLKELVKYLFGRKGALSIGPLEAVAFFNLNDPGREDCDFQFHFAPLHIGKGYDYDVYDLSTYPRSDGYTILPSLLHPKSRGHVGLKSKDAFADPLIQPNFLSEEADLQALIEGGKIAYEWLQDPVFDHCREEMVAPMDTSSDEAWAEHVRNSLETIYHPVGTCKMGKDELAVVDQNLNVHGLERLRVVDASVMPTIMTGNTNAPCYMIAEKAADLILQ